MALSARRLASRFAMVAVAGLLLSGCEPKPSLTMQSSTDLRCAVTLAADAGRAMSLRDDAGVRAAFAKASFFMGRLTNQPTSVGWQKTYRKILLSSSNTELLANLTECERLVSAIPLFVE